ncbi:hypothetical protein L2Y94_11750 [Luteibacter aegosomatis]|uniref:hypothetical protein n=1 Tax=Luteibacter aegosomatis TaxID=2911537 RepID=UPI001FF718E2|nr:hypothetical protein [Luteibacter aegosomatis]UPG84029.1 hypothetical protein L2Y94_11750 [Luteibacter aegosomatis]
MSLPPRLYAFHSTCMRIHGERRARVHRASSLPDLLRRIGRRFSPQARRMDTVLTLDVDPALAADLRGPFGPLGIVLARILDLALHRASEKKISMHVDVVGDDTSSQLVHFTVTVFGDDGPSSDAAMLADAAPLLHALGGTLHDETDERRRRHLIVELEFSLPPRSIDIDVAALRKTLGGDEPLQHVVDALEGALKRDIHSLDALLAESGVAELQAWLHRVSGVLGMAEATELARTGLTLEHGLAHGRSEWLDNAVRRFGHDAGRVLDVLRAHVDTHRI